MIQLENIDLPSPTMKYLARKQAIIDEITAYDQRVERAKALFSGCNKTNQYFKTIKSVLTRMCSGAQRCVYCEDSYADEIEHIRPKDLYPEKTFVWDNYVYACGPCNGPKNNQFAVFSAHTGAFTDVTRRKEDRVVEVEPGEPVLINPRVEDPLNFMDLDLIDTFLFLPRGYPDSNTYKRAEYTINVLQLNDREALRAAREDAFYSYRARLAEYIQKRDQNSPGDTLNRLECALKRMHHPTVWREMKRQHTLISELNVLFTQAPEALDW